MDFKKLKKDIYRAINIEFEEIVNEYPDVYSFTLDISDCLTSIGVVANTESYLKEKTDNNINHKDYFYYKYSYVEWDIWKGIEGEFNSIARNIKEYIEKNEFKFVNQDYSYTDEFLELQSKIFNICVESLKEFSNSKLYKKHSNIILNFEVREYFDEDEMIKIFSYFNHDELLISEFKKSLL